MSALECHRTQVVVCPTCRAPLMGRATAVEQIVASLRARARIE